MRGSSVASLAKETAQNKCSTSVMAGLVPAAYVAQLQNFSRLSRLDRRRPEDCGKPLPFHELGHVDGRDKPGHDDANGFTYFAPSPNSTRDKVRGAKVRAPL